MLRGAPFPFSRSLSARSGASGRASTTSTRWTTSPYCSRALVKLSLSHVGLTRSRTNHTVPRSPGCRCAAVLPAAPLPRAVRRPARPHTVKRVAGDTLIEKSPPHASPPPCLHPGVCSAKATPPAPFARASRPGKIQRMRSPGHLRAGRSGCAFCAASTLPCTPPV